MLLGPDHQQEEIISHPISADNLPGHNFGKGNAFPTPDRVADIVSCALCLLLRDKAPASVWMCLLGLIASLTAILPQCLMRMRVIQLHILSQFNLCRHLMTRQIRSSNVVCKALKWWTRPTTINQAGFSDWKRLLLSWQRTRPRQDGAHISMTSSSPERG